MTGTKRRKIMQINTTDIVSDLMIQNVAIQEKINTLYSCNDLESVKSALKNIRTKADLLQEKADDFIFKINAERI
jgi:hypothetical protein